MFGLYASALRPLRTQVYSSVMLIVLSVTVHMSGFVLPLRFLQVLARDFPVETGSNLNLKKV